jgi:hypothetical protein
MKNLIVLAVLLTVSVTCFSNPIIYGSAVTNDFNAIKNEKCKVEVHDISKMVSFGYLVGYTVEFKNNSSKVVDGIWWTVKYLNNANELIERDEESFNSTNIIDPISSGFTKLIARTPRVKGASKVEIIITKVHFSDGSSCQ